MSDARSWTSRLRIALVATFAVAILVEVLGARGVVDLPGQPFRPFGAVDDPFIAFGLLGATVLHLASRPSRDELLPSLGFGLAIGGAIALLSSDTPHRAPRALAIGLGLSSLGALLVRAVRGEGEARVRALDALVPAALLPAIVFVTDFFLRLTVRLHPTVLDPIPYAIDAAFGGQASFTVGRLFRRAPLLETVCVVVYAALPLGLAIVEAAQQRRGSRGDAIAAFLAVGTVGFALYHLLPVVGPRYVVPGWPTSEPPPASSFQPLAFSGVAPRNCMPSLHTAWALVLYWNARAVGLRLFGGAWLVLTVLATLGLGFHYAVDLVVAVPFALAAQAICIDQTSAWRTRAIVVGSVLTATWLVAMRLAPAIVARSAVAWPLAIITVVSAVAMESLLPRSAR